MKVLVTGGCGFIGSHVVDKLKDKGVEVRVFDMVMPNYRKDVEFYQGSLLNLDELRMALNGIEAVFHLAAVADVKDVFQEPHYSEAINVLDRALKYGSHIPEVWFVKGETLSMMGKIDEAVKCYGNALKINPRFYPAQQALAIIGRNK